MVGAVSGAPSLQSDGIRTSPVSNLLLAFVFTYDIVVKNVLINKIQRRDKHKYSL